MLKTGLQVNELVEQLLFEFREDRCFAGAFWPQRASQVFPDKVLGEAAYCAYYYR